MYKTFIYGPPDCAFIRDRRLGTGPKSLCPALGRAVSARRKARLNFTSGPPIVLLPVPAAVYYRFIFFFTSSPAAPRFLNDLHSIWDNRYSDSSAVHYYYLNWRTTTTTTREWHGAGEATDSGRKTIRFFFFASFLARFFSRSSSLLWCPARPYELSPGTIEQTKPFNAMSVMFFDNRGFAKYNKARRTKEPFERVFIGRFGLSETNDRLNRPCWSALWLYT